MHASHSEHRAVRETTSEHVVVDPEEATGSSTVAPTRAEVDPVALAQLWADQFQHLATLGVAGAGGLLVLLQAQILDVAEKWWLSLALFVLTAVFGMLGQIAVVDEATRGGVPGKKARIVRGVAVACLGAAGGAIIGVPL